jgi:hypothetical protein
MVRCWVDASMTAPTPSAEQLAEVAAAAVQHGIDQGNFGGTHRPEKVAVLTIGLVDGMGIPLALGDPEITVPGAVPGAVQDVLATLRSLLRPDPSL